MKLNYINGCCSAATMTANINFAAYTSRRALKEAIISELISQKAEFPWSSLYTIIFITNTKYWWFQRLLLRLFVGVHVSPQPYRGSWTWGAYTGFIKFKEPIRKTWTTASEAAAWEEQMKQTLYKVKLDNAELNQTATKSEPENANVQEGEKVSAEALV